MKHLIFLSLFFVFVNCKAQDMPNQTIKQEFQFELDKYLGTWYEIARFDHSFEKDLQGVTATYSIRKDGKIKVLNQGFQNSLNGKHKSATGKAKLAKGKSDRNLKVSFFLFFYGDYNILEVDKNYQYALIGTGSDNYLWILSRTPQMNEDTYQMLINKAQERGYNTENLIKVDQPKN